MREILSGVVVLMLLTAGCASNRAVKEDQLSDDEPRGASANLLDGLHKVFVDTPMRLVDRFNGNTSFNAARAMEDPYFPDERRKGIVKLVFTEYGKYDPYTKRYRQLAVSDPDFTVRAAAVRALNIARDQASTGTFLKALEDKSELVRLEAAKALVHLPDARTIEPLTKMVNNPAETKDVRIAAADALRHYRNLNVARSLVAVLGARDFGVAWQARQSLRRITGRDYRYDDAAWLNYLSSPAHPLG